MKKLTDPLGPFAVLDIETAPHPDLAAAAGKTTRRPASILHRMRAFALLSAKEVAADGRLTDLRLTASADDDEHGLLESLDKALAGLPAGSLIVTFNGTAHDLPFIRRRTVANWAFDLSAALALPGVSHLDLMRAVTQPRGSPFPSLRDCCAAYGIVVDHFAVPRNSPPLRPAARKCQTDVVATLIVLLHEVAAARGSDAPLEQAWREIARWLGQPGVRAPHLESFRWHPQLQAREGLSNQG